MMLLEMKNLPKYGKNNEYLKIEYHIYQNQKIGGQHDQLDLVDLIQKYFIGYEKKKIHQKIQMYEMMKIIGWKYGIMYLWNIIDYQIENLKNYQTEM
jgi:hypothetical protein